jgi:hypothetical protein
VLVYRLSAQRGGTRIYKGPYLMRFTQFSSRFFFLNICIVRWALNRFESDFFDRHFFIFLPRTMYNVRNNRLRDGRIIYRENPFGLNRYIRTKKWRGADEWRILIDRVKFISSFS